MTKANGRSAMSRSRSITVPAHTPSKKRSELRLTHASQLQYSEGMFSAYTESSTLITCGTHRRRAALRAGDEVVGQHQDLVEANQLLE